MLSTRDVDEIPPPKPPHEINPMIPAQLSKLVMDCVQINREDRPESMAVVGMELERISKGQYN